VLSFNGLSDWQWGDALEARVPVDMSRYESSYLHFTIDFPPGGAPETGVVLFRGTLNGTKLADQIAVATIAFVEP
jgi:hypothetical protein